MTRIIVPLDRSTLSEHALPAGAFLAQTFGVPLEIVHVIEKPIRQDIPEVTLHPSPESVRTDLEEVAGRYDIGVPVSINVLAGDPVRRLLQIGERDPDTILVMATHGRGGVVRTLLGSVADKVVRGASSPVMLVRPASDTSPPEPVAIQTVLVALDGSEFSERALPQAVDIARQAGAKLHLLRVVESLWSAGYTGLPYDGMAVDPQIVDAITRDLTAEASSYLTGVADRLKGEGIDVTWSVTEGRPADEIIFEAQRKPAAMIVTTTHGKGGLSRMFQGSVTTGLASLSSVPLLIVPAAKLGAADEMRYQPEMVFTL